MQHTRISAAQAETIARVWADVAYVHDDVRSDIDVRPAGDGGFLADVVVYRGSGPFIPVGTACAYIDDHGHLEPVAA